MISNAKAKLEARRVMVEAPKTVKDEQLLPAKVQNKKERTVSALNTLLDNHFQAYEKRMSKLVEQNTALIGRTLTITSGELADSIPTTVTNALRPKLVSFLEKDFTDRLEQYFQ